jgi:dUTP pyrophosphatase
MKINVKLLDNAVMPTYAKEGDAGLDLTAISEKLYPTYAEYETGVAIELPEGYVGLLFPRSSITSKTGFILGNSVGVLDSSYRGNIKFQFRHLPGSSTRYKVGDKIGQLVIMPIPKIELVEVDELSETVRGDGGFGSSGN